MSHTIKPHSCSTIREMAYNYRRGELSEVDAALFEDTIAACPACGRYASRLIDMLDAVSEAEAEDFIGKPIDAQFSEDMFASILSGITHEGVSPDVQEDDLEEPLSEDFAALGALEASLDRQHEGVVRLDDYLRHGHQHDDSMHEEDLRIPTSSARRLVLLAAALLGVVGASYFLYSTMRVEEQNSPDARATQQLARQARKIKHLKSFEALSAQPSTPDAIKVFANADARWHIEGSSPHYTLHLEQGTVLVEFLPTRKESLRVFSHETRVDVVGTVFFVSAEQDQIEDETARVGVLTGKVRVKPSPGMETVELEDGEQLEEDARVTTIESETFARSKSLIDLDAHRAVLKQRAVDVKTASHDAVAQIDAPRDEPSPTAERMTSPPPARDDRASHVTSKSSPSALPPEKTSEREVLQQAAQRAMRDKDYEGAARAIESLLDTLPEGHMERATFRLELARIYMRHIGKRDQAVHHLRLFVAQHPNDVAAPSARRQLCRLLGPESSREPACLSLTTEP